VFLKSVRIKGVSIPFRKLPRPISPEEVEEITIRIRSGETREDDLDRIILGHLRLSISIAAKYAKCLKEDHHILVAGAFYGVVWAVNKAKEKLIDNNMTGWIVSNVNRFVYEEYKKNRPKKAPSKRKSYTYDQSPEFEIQEIIDKICKSDTDKEIMTLRMQGFKDKEIASKLKRSKIWIAVSRKKIKQRFKQLNE